MKPSLMYLCAHRLSPVLAVLVAGCVMVDDVSDDLHEVDPEDTTIEVVAIEAVGSCTKTIAPGTSLSSAFGALRPGHTLCLRGGDHVAVTYTSTASDGTAANRVTVQSYPGEHARVVGITQLVDADYWTLHDLEFVRGSGTGDMVKILGGTGVILDRIDAHHSEGGAALLIGRSATYGPVNDYTLRNSTLHDTPAQSNLYLNPGQDSTGGLIERNLFWNSGTQNAKLGWGSSDCAKMASAKYGIGGAVTFRYNTLYNAPGTIYSGHQPLAFAEAVRGSIDAHRNIIYNSRRSNVPFLIRVDASPCNTFTGTASVRSTLGFDPEKATWCWNGDTPNLPSCAAVLDEDSLVWLDPKFDSIGPNGFHPTVAAAQAYGRWAP